MKRQFSFVIAVAVLFGGLLVAGVAAASGRAHHLNAPTHSSAPHKNVIGTPRGMPVTAQVRYAVVNADGTVDRSLPTVVTATHDGTGVYRVDFHNNVRTCAYIGSIGLSGAAGTSPPGTIEVVGAAASVTQVFITTHDLSGALADRGFHLSVLC
jgi:hypothetical protein